MAFSPDIQMAPPWPEVASCWGEQRGRGVAFTSWLCGFPGAHGWPLHDTSCWSSWIFLGQIRQHLCSYLLDKFTVILETSSISVKISSHSTPDIFLFIKLNDRRCRNCALDLSALGFLLVGQPAWCSSWKINRSDEFQVQISTRLPGWPFS